MYLNGRLLNSALSLIPRRSTINAPLIAETPSAETSLCGSSEPYSPPAKPLRIALLGYRSAPFSGGQGIYLKYLSRALTAQGHQVSVISGPPYPDLDDNVQLHTLPSCDLYKHGLRSVPISMLVSDPLARREWLSKLTGGFAEPWTFGERARDWLLPRLAEFDLIHDNQTLADGVLDLQRAGVPLVTTIHHPITRDRRLALDAEPRWYYRLFIERWHSFLNMQGRVARGLDHIVTVSSMSKSDIVADFGVDPARISVLHNGVDAAFLDHYLMLSVTLASLWRPHLLIHPSRACISCSRPRRIWSIVTPNSVLHLLASPGPVVTRSDWCVT